MALRLFIMILCPCLALGMNLRNAESVKPDTEDFPTDIMKDENHNKDMYVIHAMVYQVGIITNNTDDETNHTGILGNQETLTLYRSNGSVIDLSEIPEPLVTNVTAQRLVGLAPVPTSGEHPMSWTTLKKLASSQPDSINSENSEETRLTRDIEDISNTDVDYGHYDEEGTGNNLIDENISYVERLYKRSLETNMSEEVPVKIMSGRAVMPPEVGVQSIAIPSLLTINNNFSEIPVPIPNTSVISYAKINTLTQKT